MDAFYASVEQRDDPNLRGRPVIVGSNSPRGVVMAASYEAREFGVRSAMPSVRAARLCPGASWVKGNFEKYREVSNQIREIFSRHTDLVEPLSLDEAYLDVTIEKTGLGSATETAQVIRREIRDETELTASAGVAPNKFLAKIASDWNKPDGIFVIKPHQIESFLASLDVRKIPGVGKATERSLHELQIFTTGDLLGWSEADLEKRFGKFGPRLHRLARGIDERPVVSSRPRKSVSSENTFSTDIDVNEVRENLAREAERVWRYVEKHERYGRTITLKLRSADFTTLTRQVTLPQPVDSCEELLSVGRELIERFPFEATTRFRLIGLGLSGFEDQHEGSPQRDLFD